MYAAIVSDSLPASLTWGEYLKGWVGDRGGWTQLANELIDRAAATDVPQDVQSVERGLRRLATRGHKPGGQYGRWMLRYFGFVGGVAELVRWMGQYHTRFADLPCGFRLEHLTLWNRPPIAESSLVAWIHVGIAHAHLARRDPEACAHWLASAERHAPHAGVEAELECALLRAELDADVANDHVAARAGLDAIRDRLVSDVLIARHADQLARLSTRGPSIDIAAARAAYESIAPSQHPFIAFRRAAGLSYCAWKLGDRGSAITLARAAVEHAGDGGLLRMRVQGLNMLSRVLDGAEARAVHERAGRIAAQLEDEELISRVAQCEP